MFDDDYAEAMWRQLRDVPVDDDGRIVTPFMDYPSGTDREEIWRDIDNLHSQGVVHLMFPNREGDHDD